MTKLLILRHSTAVQELKYIQYMMSILQINSGIQSLVWSDATKISFAICNNPPFPLRGSMCAIMTTPWGQLVRDAFFTQVPEFEGEWRCKCGTFRRQKSTGYSNLKSHVKNKHTKDLQRFNDESNRTSTTVDSVPASLFFSKKIINLHGWFDLVIGGLLPLRILFIADSFVMIPVLGSH